MIVDGFSAPQTVDNEQASTTHSTLILRARVVLPISQPPIEDGAIAISKGRIVSVGPWKLLKSHTRALVKDLGEMVLLPGLVNAHCHLDYTHMAGLFPPQRSFCDWIKLITTEKAHWTFSDFAESWIDGAKMLLRSGTTTVGDIEAVPELLPDVWNATPLRVISFLEMTGVRSRQNPTAILDDSVRTIASLPRGRCIAALSPHAPYSTSPVLMKTSAVLSQRRRWPMAVHVSESLTEFEMFMHGHGEMFQWLRRNQRDMSDCGDVSPVQHLSRNGALSSRLMAVHVNYLARGDARLLAEKRVSVVHCPRSRDYFNHSEFPYAPLKRAGVNICLGTDSLATVLKSQRQTVELSMFKEMRAFALVNSTVHPEAILKMATINGARALGLTDKVGALKRGAFADVIALPVQGKLANACETIVHHTGNVAANMIGGAWAIAPE